MRIENANASDVLERILSAYGFTMQKELAERLEIAKSNVAGWLQRGHVPGNVIVQCSLDTGADVNWIVSGNLAKANFEKSSPVGQGKTLYDEIMSNGGKPVLRRIMDAYGFTLQKQLCELLDISSGTVSTWIRRGYFPGDIVVTCALDTGVSLEWLATGKSYKNSDCVHESNKFSMDHVRIDGGLLESVGLFQMDLSVFHLAAKIPMLIESNGRFLIADNGNKDISNGRWLIGVDNKFDIYDVIILPKKKISLTNNGRTFQCEIMDVLIEAKIIMILDFDF